MSEISKQLNLDGLDNSDTKTLSVIQWIARSNSSMEDWKKKGKDIFYSLNGQSDVARNRLANAIRKYFIESNLAPEVVIRWIAGFDEPQTIKVSPPTITAANSVYFDWVYVADYVLLPCAVVGGELDLENQKRTSEFRHVFDSFLIRQSVYEARMLLKQNSGLNDDQILEHVRIKIKDAAAAHIKEARKMERSNEILKAPVPPIEPVLMSRYTPLYF